MDRVSASVAAADELQAQGGWRQAWRCSAWTQAHFEFHARIQSGICTVVQCSVRTRTRLVYRVLVLVSFARQGVRAMFFTRSTTTARTITLAPPRWRCRGGAILEGGERVRAQLSM